MSGSYEDIKARALCFGHQHGRPRSGKPRKAAPAKRLDDDALAVLHYLNTRAPAFIYASEIAENTGVIISRVDHWLPRLYALGVVGHRAQMGGYRPSTWCGKPGRRGLGASPAVRDALASYLKSRGIGVNVDTSGSATSATSATKCDKPTA